MTGERGSSDPWRTGCLRTAARETGRDRRGARRALSRWAKHRPECLAGRDEPDPPPVDARDPAPVVELMWIQVMHAVAVPRGATSRQHGAACDLQLGVLAWRQPRDVDSPHLPAVRRAAILRKS